MRTRRPLRGLDISTRARIPPRSTEGRRRVRSPGVALMYLRASARLMVRDSRPRLWYALRVWSVGKGSWVYCTRRYSDRSPFTDHSPDHVLLDQPAFQAINSPF